MDANPDLKQKLAVAELDGSVVCTLSVNDRGQRGLEWADLGTLALTSERIEGGVASTYPISIADAVEDLAHREASCCGTWLNTTTERLGDVIRMEITTENHAGVGVILSMTGHAE